MHIMVTLIICDVSPCFLGLVQFLVHVPKNVKNSNTDNPDDRNELIN